MFRRSVLHARAAGRRARSPARRRRSARYTARLFAGCSIPGWRCDRRHAYTGEVVPGHGGPLPQLAQHHARARRARRLLHAPGDNARHRMDVARRLPRAAAHSLTLSARLATSTRVLCRANPRPHIASVYSTLLTSTQLTHLYLRLPNSLFGLGQL